MADHDPAMRVTLLGTGGPEMSIDRMGAATLVQAAGHTLLIDAGRGVLQRLYECNMPLADIRTVLFTHLHSDHVVGLPNLWITPWFLLGRQGPLRFIGPAGTRTMIAGMRSFLDFDLRNRPEPYLPATWLDTMVEEFDSGIVFEAEGLSVRAVPVDHGDGNPAVGFVIDSGGRRLVISGDCTFSEDLCHAGADTDVVIHNVFAPSAAMLDAKPHLRSVAAKLASPEQAAELFRRTGTRHAVYTHVIRLDSTYSDIAARTHLGGYDGPLTIGADRMIIEIGEQVTVRQPSALADWPDLDGTSVNLVMPSCPTSVS